MSLSGGGWLRGLRDSFSGMRAFQALPAEDRRLVFYAESKADWVHFEPIVTSLRRDHGLELCYLTSDPADPILAQEDPGLRAFQVGDGSIRTVLFRSLAADLVVMTLPDLETFHLKRSPMVWAYLYVFHSINSSHMVYLKGAFDHFDTVFCVGPHHLREIRATERHRDLRPKTLIEHGYGRLDRLLEEVGRAPPPRPAAEGIRVLVAPSWGPDGILETLGQELVQSLLQAGCHVTVRPHPMTRRKTPAALDRLTERFGGHAGFAFEADITGRDSLFASHIMVSDWSGAAYEYAFTLERPVLYIDTPRKCRNPDYAEIGIEPLEVSIRDEIGEVVSPAALESLPAAVARLCGDPESAAARIRAARARCVFNLGRSGRVGADHIAQRLAERQASGGRSAPAVTA